MCATRLATMAAQSTVYTFSARPLAGGEPLSLGSLRGKENAKNEEILNSLKYVRPGGGFEPNFPLFEKCEVNGSKAHPDDPSALMTDPKFIIWSPVCRNDIAWNFEKFLVGPDGVPVRRYSRRFPTIDIEPDIEALLSQMPSNA
uniref:Glutathione peroxidase 1 n=1 Tax=Spermophilus dauricus TaxID=99837 RepID=A0A8C9Q328_SPEDA